MKLFADDAVKAVFDRYPAPIRRKLLRLRRLVFETAKAAESVGELEETLKWGEPAYLTSQSKSGSTIRIAWKESRPNQFGMYFNCQTNLVDTFRAHFSDQFEFEGNRGIIFSVGGTVPEAALRLCILSALTYHSAKKKGRKVDR